MSKLPIVVTLAAALAAPVLFGQPVRPVSVAQLAQFLADARGQKDGRVAKELSKLSLTERISQARLAQWETEFRGKYTRQALIELADASAFLDLPPSDLPQQSSPDLNSLRLILNRAVAYVNETLHDLPDFYALRTTTRFEDIPALFEDRLPLCSIQSLHPFCLSEALQASTAVASRGSPLVAAGKSHAIVTYVDGKEVDNGHKGTTVSRSHQNIGLVTTGEFGPILSVVLGDALDGKILWGHWEQSANGPLAVFRYSVPAAKSHYVVTLPTVSNEESVRPSYHGEFSVDPATGAIYRITVIGDFAPPHEHVETSMMVQYGSVVIGGRPYICPLRGVAISRLPADPVYRGTRSQQPPLVTRLNDITFTRYHLFRAEMKILPESGSDSPVPAPASGSTAPSTR